MKATDEINLFPGLLYGGDPDNDTRPAFLQRLATGMVKDQVSWNIRGHHGTKDQVRYKGTSIQANRGFKEILFRWLL